MTGLSAIPVGELRSADYNPRDISPDAEARLDESIRRLGFAKPIIATADGLIVAGHQRTKSARRLGLESVPVYVLAREVSKASEIRFNQLHNGTDLDECDHPVRVTPGDEKVGEFFEVHASEIEGNLRSQGATIRQEIARMIHSFGPWGCAVVTESGEVVSGQQYALTCKIMALRLRVFKIRDEDRDFAVESFGQRYGEFSYAHLPRRTWIQTLAQPFRLRTTGSGKNLRSALYTDQVIPYIESRRNWVRILDFGCGQGDYVRVLSEEGYNILGWEPYRRRGAQLDVVATRAMAANLARALIGEGLFDVVVCDSVLNSVDSTQAEQDVLQCLAAFCKPGGMVFVATRKREALAHEMKRDIWAAKVPRLALPFLDKDGFSAIYRDGSWFYQRFHTEEEAKAMPPRWFGDWDPLVKGCGDSWQIKAENANPSLSGAYEAIRREFDLPLPGGISLDRHSLVMAAYRQATNKAAA